MRPPPLLALPALLLAACHCGPQDGWPHAEDDRWRVVLDPAGAHGFEPHTAPPLVLLERGDRSDTALLLGYEGVALTALATLPPSEGPCAGRRLEGSFALATGTPFPAHAGLALLGGTAAPTLRKPPANPSTTVNLARESMDAWFRGRPEPAPGSFALRSVLKLRRDHAPPLLLAAGEAGCLGVVALLDRDGAVRFAEEIPLPGPRCAPLAAMPPVDLDGDGRLELGLRAGNGEPETGVLRAVYRLALDQEPPGLERTWHEAFTPRCG